MWCVIFGVGIIGISLEVMDSINHNNDLENTKNLEKPDEELNVPLFVDVTEATQDDNNESNNDVTYQRNETANEVNSGF